MTHFVSRRSAVLRLIGAAGAAWIMTGALNVAVAQESQGKLIFSTTTVANVDATSLDLKMGEIPPREYPHMNYRSNVRFEDGAREWAAQRFHLTGNSVNKLRITIRKGDIIEKLLPVTKGFKGRFTKDQSAAYEATLDVEVAIVDINDKVLTSATAKAFTSRTVAEGTTDADKQQVWAGLIVACFDNLDSELQPQLRQVMGQYVR